MSYFEQLDRKMAYCKSWLAQRKEEGHNLKKEVAALQKALDNMSEHLAGMRVPPELARNEPDDLEDIRAQRPAGPRRLALNLTEAQLLDRLHGAWIGRAAGCILGIPCEGMSRQHIRNACKAYGAPYPLRGYWPVHPSGRGDLDTKHYGITPFRRFLGPHLRYIGADDDLAYTLLGLLILEEHGAEFTSEDVGAAWLKYLPIACTAEAVALQNLKDGFKPPETAKRKNPYTDWIGADIRSDPWGYAAPGRLEQAAEFAWRDARVSHRATGTHAAMYFSAVISAAFAVKEPVEALKLGLTEIPKNCRTAKAVRSALRRCKRDNDWYKTLDGIEKEYDGMTGVHALNNLEITVSGIYYGKGAFEKTIALTVMGGKDTDCTGATAGSIIGAIRGFKRLPAKWTSPLGNRVESYLIGRRNWKSDAIAKRFLRVARRIAAE